MRFVKSRAAIAGEDFSWPVFNPEQVIQPHTKFKCGVTLVELSGGADQILLGQICAAPPGLFVNFSAADKLLGTEWLEEDFTDAIRVEFNPPVRGVGVQFAVSSNVNGCEFTALLRASSTANAVATGEHDAGTTVAMTDNSAIFLGVVGEAAEAIKVIRLDVKPRGLTRPDEINGFFVNQLRLAV